MTVHVHRVGNWRGAQEDDAHRGINAVIVRVPLQVGRIGRVACRARRARVTVVTAEGGVIEEALAIRSVEV